MQFKVPRNVQREDTILWFITFRQFLILLVGFGMSYFMYTNLTRNYHMNQIELALCWIPAAVAVAFAFFTIKSIPLFQFLLLMIENTFFRPPRRYWVHAGGDPFVSFTTPFFPVKKKETQKAEPKNVSQKKIKNVAEMLDGKKK